MIKPHYLKSRKKGFTAYQVYNKLAPATYDLPMEIFAMEGKVHYLAQGFDWHVKHACLNHHN